MHQKYTFLQTGNHFINLLNVDIPACALQTIHQPILILFGLQTANNPGAHIGKSFVVHIHRVLGGKYQSDSKGTSLFQHAQHQDMAGWVGNRWQITENFIKINQSTQPTGAALSAHPGFYRGQQHGHKKHALVIIQMSNIENAMAWFAPRTIEQCLHIQRFTCHPVLEGRRC